jgi:hypothetical protein
MLRTEDADGQAADRTGPRRSIFSMRPTSSSAGSVLAMKPSSTETKRPGVVEREVAGTFEDLEPAVGHQDVGLLSVGRTIGSSARVI